MIEEKDTDNLSTEEKVEIKRQELLNNWDEEQAAEHHCSYSTFKKNVELTIEELLEEGRL